MKDHGICLAVFLFSAAGRGRALRAKTQGFAEIFIGFAMLPVDFAGISIGFMGFSIGFVKNPVGFAEFFKTLAVKTARHLVNFSSELS